ncbi:MAG: substrate-binding domain-containing protein [Desulforhopalus sp.]|nr:substrate-binding domain-containing protein [Desulforhopalus sp.]
MATPPEDNGFFGVLSDINLEDYIQLVCTKKSTKAIRVTQAEDKGLIIIHDGRIIFAAQDELLGIDALRTILSWTKGSFREVSVKNMPEPNIAAHEQQAFLAGPAGFSEKKVVTPSPQRTEPAAGDQNRRPSPDRGPQRDTHQPQVAALGKHQDDSKKVIIGNLVMSKKRAILALGAIVPICIILFMLQFINFSDTIPIPAFATTGKTEGGSAATAKQPGLAKVPDPAGGQVIAIAPLVKQEAPKNLPEETVLRLHGSNTIGAKLAPALISGYFTNILKAEKVVQLPGQKENETLVKATFKDGVKVVEIHAHGSTTGFKDLATESCDIGMSSRKIKEKEITELSRFGEMTATTNEHVIALDGIAVIVNKANRLSNLTVQEIADIFSGKITNWSQVGGTAGEITVYARDENSGTYDTFKSIVLDKLELKQGIKRFESNPELSAQVAGDPFGIGFTSLPNINKAKAIAVADSGAKPIFPSFFTVATEDYPIARRLYLYTPTHPKNSHVRDFIEFVHSPEGQEITNKIDLVDMNIKTFFSERPDPGQIANPAKVEEYMKATNDAQRLSLNFRFHSGKFTLDNRSERDLSRVVDFLKDKLDRKIILAGFADNAGDYEANIKLARVRAESVADQLRARGITIGQITSCGQELPVASNASAAGKDKNRRVEVWLR